MEGPYLFLSGSEGWGLEGPRASKRKSDPLLSRGVPSGVDLELAGRLQEKCIFFFCLESSAAVLASLERVGVGEGGCLGRARACRWGWWRLGGLKVGSGGFHPKTTAR